MSYHSVNNECFQGLKSTFFTYFRNCLTTTLTVYISHYYKQCVPACHYIMTYAVIKFLILAKRCHFYDDIWDVSNSLPTHSFCLNTVAFNKLSSYSNAWIHNISKTLLIFKIWPEMTKLHLNFNIRQQCKYKRYNISELILLLSAI